MHVRRRHAIRPRRRPPCPPRRPAAPVVWGRLRGPVGALLAVPRTVAAVIAGRHTPGARGVATLLAGGDAQQEA